MNLDIVGKLMGGVKSVVSRVITTETERGQVEIELQKILQDGAAEIEASVRQEMASRERVIVAEMQSGDNYTRRARPTVVYAGLAAMAVNHIVLPWIAYYSGNPPPSIEIPGIFWTAWGGVVATWSVGRTMEKRGATNKAVGLITG